MIRFIARVGTGLCLIALVYSCATVPGLREESTGSFIRVPFVRVLLEENQSQFDIGATGQFGVECLQAGRQEVFYTSNPVNIKVERGLLTVRSQSGKIIAEDLNEVNIIPRGTNNRVRIGKDQYRGIVKVLPYAENLQVINTVYMEDYLRGVVPPEIGNRNESELEAVKAQAVAARTYAMAHLKQYGDKPYDMKSSIIDQVYKGASGENKLINRAIDITAGDVLMYDDEFVNAYYHSTCGGTTDDISHVWDRKEVPYLKAVADSGACSWSKYYRWEEHFTEKQLRGRIEQYLSSDRGRDLRIGPITDVTIGGRTAGGRVEQMSIRTDSDVYRFKKDRIRWVVGRTSNPDLILPSDRFDIDLQRDARGEITKVTFQGRGYGHGVGMCQCGAIGLAREGWTYDRILTHYYSNVDLNRLY